MDTSLLEIIRRSRKIGFYLLFLFSMSSIAVFFNNRISAEADLAALRESNSWSWYSAKRNRQIQLLALASQLKANTGNQSVQSCDYTKFIKDDKYSRLGSIHDPNIMSDLCYITFLIEIAQSEPLTAEISSRKYKSTCDIGDGLDQIGQCALDYRKIHEAAAQAQPFSAIGQLFLAFSIILMILSLARQLALDDDLYLEKFPTDSGKYKIDAISLTAAFLGALLLLYSWNLAAEPLLGKDSYNTYWKRWQFHNINAAENYIFDAQCKVKNVQVISYPWCEKE